MAATHKIQAVFDEATGKVVLRHFVTTTVGGHRVTIHEDIETEGDAIEKFLKRVIELNREEMDERATVQTAQHVAVMSGKFKGKTLKLAGNVTAEGESEQKKL